MGFMSIMFEIPPTDLPGCEIPPEVPSEVHGAIPKINVYFSRFSGSFTPTKHRRISQKNSVPLSTVICTYAAISLKTLHRVLSD